MSEDLKATGKEITAKQFQYEDRQAKYYLIRSSQFDDYYIG